MPPLSRFATLLVLLVWSLSACAERPRSPVAASTPIVNPSRSLALLGASDPRGADLAIVWSEAPTPVPIAPGDRLEYRVLAATAGLEQAGIEIRFDDRSVLLPPARPQARWQLQSIDLRSHAGRRIASVSIAARGPVTRPVLVLVDEVAIVRASGAREVLFEDVLDTAHAKAGAGSDRNVASSARSAAGSEGQVAARTYDTDSAGFPGRIEARDTRAVCLLAPDRERYPDGWLPADDSAAFGAWWPLDLARPESAASSDGGTSAYDALPTGTVLIDAGLPLRFAEPGEAASVALHGQRLPLRPLDGGRYYELVLALEGPPGARTTFEIQGRLGERGSLSIRLPPAGPASSGSGDLPFHVLRLPIAATFAIDAVRAPEDDRLRLHAASLRWQKDAPSDARFRRAWIAHEEPSPDVARWLRSTDLGAAFVPLSHEDLYERKLFDLLLAHDRQGFRALLAQRLERVSEGSTTLGDARIDCVPVIDLEGRGEHEIQNVLALFDARPTLVAVLRGAGSLAALAGHRPALAERILELVRAGRIEIAGCTASGGRAGTQTGEALWRDLALGLRWAHAKGIEPRLGDLEPATAAGIALPAALAAAGITRAISVGGPGCLTRVETEDGASIDVLTLDTSAAGGALERPAELAQRIAGLRSRTGSGTLALALPLDGSVHDQRLLEALDDLAATELAPRARIVLASVLIDELAARRDAFVPVLELPMPIQPDADEAELCAAERAAGAALLRAERFGALAQVDGLAWSVREDEELWATLFSAGREEPAERRAAVASVRERAERLSQLSLAVLARAARTSGGRGEQWLVFNPLPWEREELVEVESNALGVLDADLAPVAAQRARGGRLLFRARVPALGYALYHLVPEPSSGPAAELAARFEGPELGWTLQSDRLACRIEPALGRIATLRAGREELELFSASSGALAWNGAASAALATLLRERPELELVEGGPLRATLRGTREHGGVRLVQEYSLASGSAELATRFSLEGELEAGDLRALYLLAHAGDGASFAIAGGVASTAGSPLRATALDGWVARAEAGLGLALLSDSAAGFESPGKVLSLALAPGLGAGVRKLEREVTLLAAHGSELQAEAARRAEERAQPLVVRPASAHEGARPARHEFLSIVRSEADGKRMTGSAADVALETLQPADGGGWLVRLRERRGSTARLVLVLDRPVYAAETVDLLGRTRDPLACKDRRVVVELRAGGVETLRVRLRP
jgi:hypothetical protein